MYTAARRRLRPFAAFAWLLVLVCARSSAARIAEAPVSTAEAVAQGALFLLDAQEGEADAEWPYEGVYRVGGRIPMGYRVGGTALVAWALSEADVCAELPECGEALERGVDFVLSLPERAEMGTPVVGSYDVRGWGWACALQLLARRVRADALTPAQRERADAVATFCIDALVATEIPRNGGWNYSRRGGFDAVTPSSPFMTGFTLQALFEARAAGWAVPVAVVERALEALQLARASHGGVVYSGRADRGPPAAVPGAVGRMLCAETTLTLAGRGSADDLRGALDAFLVHWDWLEQRRAQTGTHVPPYDIAPYYFHFAHLYAAQAVEQLPKHERDEYRRRVHERVFATRADDGTWNDRVFPRSASYGTALSMLALTMAQRLAPARWEGGVVDEAGESAHDVRLSDDGADGEADAAPSGVWR